MRRKESKEYALAREMQAEEEEEEKKEERERETKRWKKRRCICEVLYVPWCVSQGGGTCVSECFARMPGKREKSVRNAEGTERRRTEGGSARNREPWRRAFLVSVVAVRRHFTVKVNPARCRLGPTCSIEQE